MLFFITSTFGLFTSIAFELVASQLVASPLVASALVASQLVASAPVASQLVASVLVASQSVALAAILYKYPSKAFIFPFPKTIIAIRAINNTINKNITIFKLVIILFFFF